MSFSRRDAFVLGARGADIEHDHLAAPHTLEQLVTFEGFHGPALLEVLARTRSTSASRVSASPRSAKNKRDTSSSASPSARD
jgi:hypothetical protein